MKRIIITLIAATALAGCQRETGPDPLKLTGKMFVFNYRLAYATYMITLNKTEPVPDGSVVVASFENPAGGGPLTLTRKLFPKLDKVTLESPEISCVKKEKPYVVTIEVKGPDGATLQKLETTVTSDVDQDVLPAKPLVEGPAYDKNPEVFVGGRAPERFETAGCPTS
ncbi:membrane lipoprotein lipid attachment site-containing protein [Ensifer sp. IC4062]|nr:membrane lipoprotein lipid attachment site-containing protein [Ensifer sp. IC4062]MCA1439011.1 membrane lipoprotein lipid attachment site-containing protein [Ensifer sp. IC4062]